MTRRESPTQLVFSEQNWGPGTQQYYISVARCDDAMLAEIVSMANVLITSTLDMLSEDISGLQGDTVADELATADHHMGICRCRGIFINSLSDEFDRICLPFPKFPSITTTIFCLIIIDIHVTNCLPTLPSTKSLVTVMLCGLFPNCAIHVNCLFAIHFLNPSVLSHSAIFCLITAPFMLLSSCLHTFISLVLLVVRRNHDCAHSFNSLVLHSP